MAALLFIIMILFFIILIIGSLLISAAFGRSGFAVLIVLIWSLIIGGIFTSVFMWIASNL